MTMHACIRAIKKLPKYKEIFVFVWTCLKEYVTSRGKGEYQIDYVPAPRITEADKNNDKRYALGCLICAIYSEKVSSFFELQLVEANLIFDLLRI